MKIAFTGKGGSGKSTLSYQMVKYLLAEDYRVLAIDADHNMDLAFSLDQNFNGPFLGELAKGDSRLTFEKFSLNPVDSFTERYAHSLKENLRLMVAGPHTDEVLEGKRCSHSLSSPLKKYLPRLELQGKEAVVVDEKAGSDGVGTGALKGFDHVFVVTEPTPQSVKASHQIADILEYYRIPYSFVLNKVRPGQDLSKLELRKEPIHAFPFDPDLADPSSSAARADLSDMLARVATSAAMHHTNP